MNPHLFLFHDASWIGEGKISFSGSKDTIRFFTRWRLMDQMEETFIWLQEVELHGLNQTNRNLITVNKEKDTHFKISLDNELMGKISGKGVITPETIAWELREQSEKRGYEVYELQENGDYLFRAEYVSNEPFRTLIEGKIWKK